jgi:hypothetical protein
MTLPNTTKLNASILHCMNVLAFAGILVCSSPVHAVDNEIEVSGFARVVAGYLDDKNADYLGYDNTISIDQQSLFGLQVEWPVSAKLSFTTQLLAHSSDTRDSGAEWLYLTYQANESLRIKLGKMRTPFFSYSEHLDVGYAYPWITPPQLDYSIFTTYTGANASLSRLFDGLQLYLEAYYGNFSGDIYVADSIFNNAGADDLHGLIAKVSNNNLEFRVAWHQTTASTESPELTQFATQLAQLGYTRSAASLNTRGTLQVTQISIIKEALDYFARLEWLDSRSRQITNPDVQIYSASLGLYRDSLTHYLSYIYFRNAYPSPQNEILDNVSPQLDALSAAYQNLFQQLPRDDLSKYVIGTRWDLQNNLALKAEIAFLVGRHGQRSLFSIKNDVEFDRQATLYQVSLEWVF